MKIGNLINQVLQLHERKYSVREISQETGLSKSKVGRMVKEYKDSELGTAAGTRPTDALQIPGTANGTALDAVPAAGWDASGTADKRENRAAEAAKLARERENRAYDAMLREGYKHGLSDSYQNFLNNISTFLTMEFRDEESARSLLKCREERANSIYQLAERYCSYCDVEFNGLYMNYVIRELHLFLVQEPELVQIDRGVKIKEGVVLEQFIKQIERMDIFSPMRDDLAAFPATEAL